MNEIGLENADGLTVLGLGGNLSGRHATVAHALEAAAARLPDLGLRLVARSRWWRSAAWPDPGQPAYLNGVALVGSRLAPGQILAALRGLEAEFGPRAGPRNSPRVLDLDLIAHGRDILDTPELTLPHPRAAERLFVMGPLAEIAPLWRHPVLGMTAETLARRASVGLDAHPVS
jgi:2-amino-4-hydroxy-6-hydroxymethyldihydropteridine diphosphokinase